MLGELAFILSLLRHCSCMSRGNLNVLLATYGNRKKRSRPNRERSYAENRHRTSVYSFLHSGPTPSAPAFTLLLRRRGIILGWHERSDPHPVRHRTRRPTRRRAAFATGLRGAAQAGGPATGAGEVGPDAPG